MECKEAKDALIYSLVGIVCLGIILEPIAIYKALQAKKIIAMNPQLDGIGKANAALTIGILLLVVNVVYWGLFFAGMATGIKP